MEVEKFDVHRMQQRKKSEICDVVLECRELAGSVECESSPQV